MTVGVCAQRVTDKLDRGLVAMKVSGGIYLNWRILAEEYYDVTYNVYRDGVKLNAAPLSVSNYTDATGTTSNSYAIAAVVRGTELAPSAQVKPWTTSYKEIKLTHEGIKSTLVPNDACCADVDGDGELEILMKFDNESEISQSFPKNGPTVGGVVTKEYSIMECLKLDGTRLWWVNCGPNMGDFQNNEQNIVAYDWDQDGCAEVVMRACDGTTIHYADGTTYTVGNANVNVRGATGGGANWFVITTGEYLLYMDGKTGQVHQCLPYPLKLLEDGESDVNKAWGDGYGHRASKHFFGAPYLDGRKPSIFLARGIYTRHKMIALDVDPATHQLSVRWRWNCNDSSSPWYGNGYHNYAIADVDWDGRDEICFGSMVIDDNGKGLSTTGYGHGEAQHNGDFNPYVHGQEIFACIEDSPVWGNNYRDGTTSKVYYKFTYVDDEGRCIAGNFSNDYPGAMAFSSHDTPISCVTADHISGMEKGGIPDNFRIYWDGDLCDEGLNYINGKNTAGGIYKYGMGLIETLTGSMTNNDTKGTPCYQGDILGDWREEVIMRTNENKIRIFTTTIPTEWRNYTLWHDMQYRQAMVWQMCGYNQPPHTSYFLGELEGITIAPPPLTMTGRTEVANGGTVGHSLDGQHVIVCETGNSSVSIEAGAQPEVLTFNVPTWVQGTAPSECTTQNMKINYTTYECTVGGGGLSGTARLVKQGDGVLTLPAAEFTHTGATDVWGGTLCFDGTMKQSPLWLNRFARLNSNGGEFLSIKADYGAVVCPGDNGVKATITADELALGFGSRIVVDLFGSDLTADFVKVKTLKIERKTGNAWTKGGPEYLMPVVEVVGHGETMTPGKYIIGEVSQVEGSIDDLIVEGMTTTKKKLYIEDGNLILEIVGLRDPADVAWTGAEGNSWDYAETQNFMVDGEQTVFVSGDNVTFNNEAAQKSITLNDELYPGVITVEGSNTFSFNGTGSWGGGASFVNQGTGTVTINTKNSYTGGNHLKGGTTRVSLLANQYSEVGNLGSVTSSPSLFTMENGATLQATAAVETASPMQMVGDEGGAINASADFRMNAALSGTVLTKKGSGCLYLMKSGSLQNLVLVAGSVALQNNTAVKSIELQNGTLWDDVQSTSHAIVVPKGKSATWQLSNAYYTAYNNKLTGEGTLTIVPRNTVSRVRITGNWSEFQGTIKHTTKNIWLPLDASTGMANATLDIAEGCTVTNVAKAFAIGKLTGKGSLAHPTANFQNQSAVSGNNTWNVGNSDLGDFTFDGIFTDAGGANKCIFNKVGACKMTVSGKSDHTGATNVKEGELCLKSGAQLGKGALSVGAGAVLSGITTAKLPLLNSSFNINGMLKPGSLPSSTTGTIYFNNKNVTIGNTGVLVIRASRNGGSTSLADIGTLTINGTIRIEVSETNTLQVGDEIRLWSETVKLEGEPQFDMQGDITWDTSRISEGVLVVKDVNTGIANPGFRIPGDDVYDLRGHKVSESGTPNSELKKGIYIRGGKKVVITK